MKAYEFDGEKYKMASKHQKEWGGDLISELSLLGNETILDLGCGDGVLTEQLSLLVPNGKVLGIDASINMIATAKRIHRKNLAFAHMNINELNLTDEFDLIFSNAALHWITDHKKLLKNSYKALKTNGRILWDFGGAGNCSNFSDVIRIKISEDKYRNYFRNFKWPWFMPSKQQYETLLSDIGFSTYTIKEINRDRYFSNAAELTHWIDQPCIVPFLDCIPQQLKESFRQEVIDEMQKRTEQEDGTYFETFRRIKVFARK